MRKEKGRTSCCDNRKSHTACSTHAPAVRPGGSGGVHRTALHRTVPSPCLPVLLPLTASPICCSGSPSGGRQRLQAQDSPYTHQESSPSNGRPRSPEPSPLTHNKDPNPHSCTRPLKATPGMEGCTHPRGPTRRSVHLPPRSSCQGEGGLQRPGCHLHTVFSGRDGDSTSSLGSAPLWSVSQA